MKKRTVPIIILSLIILLIMIFLVFAFESPSTYQQPHVGGTSSSTTKNANLPNINNIKVIFGENSASSDYEAAKLIKNKLLTDYNIILIRDVDYQDDGTSSIVSIGGSCINKVSAQLLSLDYPKCGNDFTSKTKVSANQYLIKSGALSNNRLAVIIAGYDAIDTWVAANNFNSLNIGSLTTDLNIIKSTSLAL